MRIDIVNLPKEILCLYGQNDGQRIAPIITKKYKDGSCDVLELVKVPVLNKVPATPFSNVSKEDVVSDMERYRLFDLRIEQFRSRFFYVLYTSNFWKFSIDQKIISIIDQLVKRYS